MKNLPNNLIFKILNEDKLNRQNEVWKKRHNLCIRHLEEYLEEMGTDPETDPVQPDLIYDGNIRYDIRFLENNDAWGTTLNKCIYDHHGEEEVNYFADNCF